MRWMPAARSHAAVMLATARYLAICSLLYSKTDQLVSIEFVHTELAMRRGPSGPLRALFGSPSRLYGWDLGWLLGHRFLALTYRGRRTGRTLRTVLEVIGYDPSTQESVVASAYGLRAGWYLSIRSAPALLVETGRLRYAPQQRFLAPDEARAVSEAFCRAHPIEARLGASLLGWIGAAIDRRPASVSQTLASLPMVAFRPQKQ
jgi:hypothetical protein